MRDIEIGKPGFNGPFLEGMSGRNPHRTPPLFDEDGRRYYGELGGGTLRRMPPPSAADREREMLRIERNMFDAQRWMSR